MNRDKRGRPYAHPASLIDFAARVKDFMGLASRVLEGFLLGLKKQPYVKVHLAVDVRTGEIKEFALSDDSVDDNVVFPMLSKTATKRVLADSAYDDSKNDAALKDRDVTLVVPPRRNSRVRRRTPPDKTARNERVHSYSWARRSGRSVTATASAGPSRRRSAAGSGCLAKGRAPERAKAFSPR